MSDEKTEAGMTDTTGRNRVQAGVPTGGQFATGTRSETEDLMPSTEVRDAITEARISGDMLPLRRALIARDGITAEMADADSGSGMSRYVIRNPRHGTEMEVHAPKLTSARAIDVESLLLPRMEDAAAYEYLGADVETWRNECDYPANDEGYTAARERRDECVEAAAEMRFLLGADYALYCRCLL